MPSPRHAGGWPMLYDIDARGRQIQQGAGSRAVGVDRTAATLPLRKARKQLTPTNMGSGLRERAMETRSLLVVGYQVDVVCYRVEEIWRQWSYCCLTSMER